MRRVATGLLLLALTAAAALLAHAALAPSPAGPAIRLSGVDGGETVDVTLTLASRAPGPNRYTVEVSDHDAGDEVRPRRVRIAFTPIDDPGVRTTALTLAETGEGSYEGTGANLAFDGRWRLTVLVESLTGTAEVRFELSTEGGQPTTSR